MPVGNFPDCCHRGSYGALMSSFQYGGRFGSALIYAKALVSFWGDLTPFVLEFLGFCTSFRSHSRMTSLTCIFFSKESFSKFVGMNTSQGLPAENADGVPNARITLRIKNSFTENKG